MSRSPGQALLSSAGVAPIDDLVAFQAAGACATVLNHSTEQNHEPRVAVGHDGNLQRSTHPGTRVVPTWRFDVKVHGDASDASRFQGCEAATVAVSHPVARTLARRRPIPSSPPWPFATSARSPERTTWRCANAQCCPGVSVSRHTKSRPTQQWAMSRLDTARRACAAAMGSRVLAAAERPTIQPTLNRVTLQKGDAGNRP